MNDDLWVDWVRDYSEKMKNLDSMSREQKNDEIQRYVQSIGYIVSIKTREHIILRSDLNYLLLEINLNGLTRIKVLMSIKNIQRRTRN